jgi:hypothetical protein
MSAWSCAFNLSIDIYVTLPHLGIIVIILFKLGRDGFDEADCCRLVLFSLVGEDDNSAKILGYRE